VKERRQQFAYFKDKKNNSCERSRAHTHAAVALRAKEQKSLWELSFKREIYFYSKTTAKVGKQKCGSARVESQGISCMIEFLSRYSRTTRESNLR
jgi:hypothetical protein